MTAVAACAALAVAGCAVPRQSPRQPTTHPATVQERPGRVTAASPPASHQQRAAADTAAILASFVPPPGARRLSGAPAADGGALRQPFQTPGVFHLMEKASWWLAPGQPRQVLGWERAHLPRRFAYAGDTTYGSSGNFTLWGDQFSLPAVPGLLVDRDLLVAVVSAGGGRTAIRVDAQVAWVPAKPADERVPSVARVVTVTVLPSNGPGGPARLQSVTISDAATVRRIAALVDSLPLAPYMTVSCPAFDGGEVRLAFLGRVGGPVLAAVSSNMDGCPPADFTAGGKQLPMLAGGSSFGPQVAALAGLRLRAGASGGGTGAAGLQPG